MPSIDFCAEGIALTDFLEMRYEKDPSIVYREIAGEAVLVPIRRNVADLESIYTLNDVGGFIWNLIDGQCSNQGIKAALLDEYDAPPAEVEVHLREFLLQLEGIGAIVQV